MIRSTTPKLKHRFLLDWIEDFYKTHPHEKGNFSTSPGSNGLETVLATEMGYEPQSKIGVMKTLCLKILFIQ